MHILYLIFVCRKYFWAKTFFVFFLDAIASAFKVCKSRNQAMCAIACELKSPSILSLTARALHHHHQPSKNSAAIAHLKPLHRRAWVQDACGKISFLEKPILLKKRFFLNRFCLDRSWHNRFWRKSVLEKPSL